MATSYTLPNENACATLIDVMTLYPSRKNHLTTRCAELFETVTNLAHLAHLP